MGPIARIGSITPAPESIRISRTWRLGLAGRGKFNEAGDDSSHGVAMSREDLLAELLAELGSSLLQNPPLHFDGLGQLPAPLTQLRALLLVQVNQLRPRRRRCGGLLLLLGQPLDHCPECVGVFARWLVAQTADQGLRFGKLAVQLLQVFVCLAI
ncbi:hypothetical protein [Fontivita pretiosa]|uniref:hypothetical protein n=1 Tax=Fontivita pretiosa TaxID=2989684 RepID=UPI003D167454